MPDPVIVEERNVNQEAIATTKDMAQKLMKSIEDLKLQIREGNQMIDDALTADAAYMDAAGKAEVAAKTKTSEKKRIQSRPEMIQLALKVKSLKDELKQKKLSLSDYLLE